MVLRAGKAHWRLMGSVVTATLLLSISACTTTESGGGGGESDPQAGADATAVPDVAGPGSDGSTGSTPDTAGGGEEEEDGGEPAEDAQGPAEDTAVVDVAGDDAAAPDDTGTTGDAQDDAAMPPDGGGEEGDAPTTIEDTGPPVPDENCINGEDDDEDGDVDCEDDDCAANPSCQEDCDNGEDDDGDGAADCDDTECVCTTGTESCGDMYDCLVETGCDCTLDVDCPDGPDDYGNCLQKGSQTQANFDACHAELSPYLQQSFDAWQECISTNCGGVSGDAFVECYQSACVNEYMACFGNCDEGEGKEPLAAHQDLKTCAGESCDDLTLNECYDEQCLEEVTECFYSGTATCAEGYTCIGGCPDDDPNDECLYACLNDLSSESAYNLFSWEFCRFGVCDADGDGTQDSTACSVVSAWFACGDLIGSCVDPYPFTGMSTCGQTADCALACSTFDADIDPCIGSCIFTMAPEAVEGAAALWTCVIEACGTTAEALTPACAASAMTGACAAEAEACGVGACTSDADCEDGEVCDVASGDCVPAPGCQSDADCEDGEICDVPTGDCVPAPGCTTDEDCEPGEACDVATGDCVASACAAPEPPACAGVVSADCVDAADCPADSPVCNPDLCTCEPVCTEDADCPAHTPHCVALVEGMPDFGMTCKCESHAECAAYPVTAGNPAICHDASGQCISMCETDADCDNAPSGKWSCNASSPDLSICAPYCDTAEDCEPGMECVADLNGDGKDDCACP